LRNRKLNNLKFRRQYAFWRYITDFYCFEKNLVIELDWWVHSLKEQKEYDKIRDEVIQKYKVNILRLKNEEIYNNIELAISKILYFCFSSSPSGEVGWGLNNSQKKIKKEKSWDKCRKCVTPVIKAIPKKKNTKNKNFYYEYYLTCPSCKTNYFVDDAKIMINKLDF
jgi:very-short-patch-repair endonuclease